MDGAMSELTNRSMLLPEPELPCLDDLLSEGRRLARGIVQGRTAFLDHHGVASEADYKRRAMAEGRVMFHSQVGYRDLDQTRRACIEIHEALERSGHRIDRFGMIFDQNMGYPPHLRPDMPKGTGLIVDDPRMLQEIADSVPVGLHFGDFMLGFPASVENVTLALEAGAGIIGNLGQFYAYKLLYLDDDVARAATMVKAIAMIAAQPREVMVSSNVDDGFGPLFADLACAMGLVLVEQYVVEDLLGGRAVTVFGNIFADPFKRMVFQRALGRIGNNPGPMVYGNTIDYDTDHEANRATLANYLTFDVIAQQTAPTGHAVVPIPVTEYERIPDPSEIVEAQRFAHRIAEKAHRLHPLVDFEAIEAEADRLVEGGRRFKANLLRGFAEAGIDVTNPLEVLLAVRRAGPRRLEEWFGPGQQDAAAVRGRRAVIAADGIEGVMALSQGIFDSLPPRTRQAVEAAGYTACVASTDVHEYGKLAMEQLFDRLGVEVVDGGVSAEAEAVVARALEGGADFIALGTYNGIALSYLSALRQAMAAAGLDIPVFVGGRLNEVPAGSNTSLPVDVAGELEAQGAVVCASVEEMLERLAAGLPGIPRAA